MKIATNVPKDVQVDWEGILRPTPEDFIASVSPWIYPARRKVTMDLPDVSSACPTIRTLLEALNAVSDCWQESDK